MSRTRVTLAVAVIAGVLLAPAGAQTPSRVLDRTFSCEAGYVGGLYQVQLSTTFQTGPASTRLEASASVTKDQWESPYGQLGSAGLSIHRRLCVPARGTVRLTTKGMRGGAVPPLGSDARCETPPRVLMRVRALFARPPEVSTSRRFGFPQLIASGAVKEAAIAVGTPTGRPIAYVSVTGTEKARLFTLRRCKED